MNINEELKWCYGLTKATEADKKRIAKLHTHIYGASIHVCVNCPTSLRAAVRRLKLYYEQRD